MKKKSILLLMLILSLLGMPLTIYLTYLHYKPEASTFCVLSEQFNCDIVNKSSYAEIFGIPVAIFGFLGYVLFFVLTYGKLIILNKKKINRDSKLTKYLFMFTLLGFLFSLYLTFLEAFIILAWCIFCLISATLVTIMFIYASILYKRKL